MPLDTVVRFLDSLRQNHLLEPEQLIELDRSLLSRFSQPRVLAGELIRLGWLTPYQANQLLQGRGKELLLGSYVLLERLGAGGMGQVFKAKNWKLGRIVALKLIRKERLSSEDAVRRFHREIRAAAQLSHPNIVLAYDADEVHGTHFFAMEYVEGSDLAKLLKQHGPMPVAHACDWIRQAALGLQHAHERGLVHRDIKPHNLLLTKQGVVKILDMGLARLTAAGDDSEASTTMTQEGLVMGTPDYMAPEQAEESHGVDIRADLYSLGCTLYHLLSGKVPFPGGTLIQKLKKHQFEQPLPIEQCCPDVPPAVAAVLRKLMAKRAEDRYQTPADLVHALETLSSGDSRTLVSSRQTPARPAPVEDTVNEALDFRPTDESIAAESAERRSRQKSATRSRLFLGVGSGVVLLGSALVLWLLLGRSTPPSSTRQPIAREQSRPRKPQQRSFEQWRREVAELPAEQQVEAVAKKLQEHNPGFDGKVTHEIKGDVVTLLEVPSNEVADVSPIQALSGLRHLDISGVPPGKGKLVDLSPLKGVSLTVLKLSNTQVRDLSPLQGMPLRFLGCGGSDVSDLSPLQGMSLHTLYCNNTMLVDLSPLKSMPLTMLVCYATQVTDLSPLRDMPLKELSCDFNPYRDAEILRSIKTLEKINNKPVTEFWKEVDDKQAAFDAWCKEVAKLPAEEQVKAVAAELKKRNPGFDGEVQHKIVGDKVTELKLCTDEVTDIAPVRALPALRQLDCSGSPTRKGKLADLWPLHGLPLNVLECRHTQVADLAPLRGMALRNLSCTYTRISDLSPLQGMRLGILGLDATDVTNLAPLRGMHLIGVSLSGKKITDWSPLKGMKLKFIYCDKVPDQDRKWLQELPSLKTINGRPAAEFWKKVSDPPAPKP